MKQKVLTTTRVSRDEDGKYRWTYALNMYKNPAILVVVVFIAISLLAYLIVAWMYGGRYIVHFTMDEKTLVHETEPAQASKARKMGMATVGVMTASRSGSYAPAGMARSSSPME